MSRALIGFLLRCWLPALLPALHQTDWAEDIRLVRRLDKDPSPLLDHRYFFASDRVHVCYALAGTFTGFLVRRFGWDLYRRFYRRANSRTFRSVFQSDFGMSLEEAWRRCRDESVVMANLNWRLRQDRLFNTLH
jgi:hypothetical protein